MTASALENSLNAIEGKVDEMLAAFEEKGNVTLDEPAATHCTDSQLESSPNQREDSSKIPPK
jgi:hypothetical protein